MNCEETEARLSKQGEVGASFSLHNVVVGFHQFCILFTIFVSDTNCVNHSDEMIKKGKVEWSKIDGLPLKLKWLHLGKGGTDNSYHSAIQLCDHNGFKSQRGCRKDLNTKHS